MKKLVILVLLVPILALTMISCDADMRSNLAGWMGGFNGNVYADAGFIVPNTAQAEAAAATIAAIGTGTGVNTVPTSGPDKGKTSSMGVEVSVADGTTLLAPQSKDKQKELKDNLGDAFNSDTQKKKLLDDLKGEVKAGTPQQKAAQGTVTVLNATLDKIKADLGINSELGKTLEKLKLPVIADGDDLTQGDLLALQLMTDLISNTVNTLTEIGGTLGGASDAELEKPANKAKVLSIIDDALFAAEVAEQISGAASIDFTGQIDLGSLMDGLGDDKGSRSSGDPIKLTDAEDFIGTINALAPSIVELMGVTNDGTTFTYTDAKYKSFLLNQQIYRSSMEQALKMMELGKLKKAEINSLTFDTSTLVKYALAVLITEHDAFVKSGVGGTDDTAAVIQNYLNVNPKLGFGTLTKEDEIEEPTSSIDYDKWGAFLKNSSMRKGDDEGKTYLKSIFKNLLKVNELGGIAQLSTVLNEFLTGVNADNEAVDDNFDKFYDDLMSK